MSEPIKPGMLAIGIGPNTEGKLFSVQEEAHGFQYKDTGLPAKVWLCITMQPIDGCSVVTGRRWTQPAGELTNVLDESLRPLQGPPETVETKTDEEVPA